MSEHITIKGLPPLRSFNERDERLMALPGYVVLGWSAEEQRFYGTVENSFSLGLSPAFVQFNWSSDNATSNFGGKFKVDGLAMAQRDLESWSKSRPDLAFRIYDARNAEALPVVLDWDGWLDANQPNPNSLSGVVDKYRSRNIRFTAK
jgi:hypothetical protein